jgi:hypothetical protein
MGSWKSVHFYFSGRRVGSSISVRVRYLMYSPLCCFKPLVALPRSVPSGSSSSHLTHRSRLLLTDAKSSESGESEADVSKEENDMSLQDKGKLVASSSSGKEEYEPGAVDILSDGEEAFIVKEHKRVSLSCLQIQEEDGEWRYADLYEFDRLNPARDTTGAVRVVVHFGGIEFEGLGDNVYRLQLAGGGGFAFSGDPALGKLLDSDGDLISTRSEEHPHQGFPSLL